MFSGSAQFGRVFRIFYDFKLIEAVYALNSNSHRKDIDLVYKCEATGGLKEPVKKFVYKNIDVWIINWTSSFICISLVVLSFNIHHITQWPILLQH